jgi:hypothetical protein
VPHFRNTVTYWIVSQARTGSHFHALFSKPLRRFFVSSRMEVGSLFVFSGLREELGQVLEMAGDLPDIRLIILDNRA